MRWLDEPEVARWWGPKSGAEAEIRLALESPLAICRIIEADGRAIGYCHAVDASTWASQLPPDLPAGTWDADIMIGDPEARGRGFGITAMRELCDEVFSTTLALGICLFVSVKNEPAVRAYEKAGFRWQRIWHDPVAGPEWMMLMPRPER